MASPFIPSIKLVHPNCLPSPLAPHIKIASVSGGKFHPTGAALISEAIHFLAGAHLSFEEALRQAMRWAVKFEIGEILVIAATMPPEIE